MLSLSNSFFITHIFKKLENNILIMIDESASQSNTLVLVCERCFSYIKRIQIVDGHCSFDPFFSDFAEMSRRNVMDALGVLASSESIGKNHGLKYREPTASCRFGFKSNRDVTDAIAAEETAQKEYDLRNPHRISVAAVF